MAEVIHRDKRDGYIYDPVIKGYDTTFWKSVTGTPTVSGSVVRYNAAVSASYLLHIFADIEFKLTVPVKPTAGDVRYWGFRNPSGDTRGGAYFKIAGAVFSAVVYSDSGATSSVTLTWDDTDWTAAVVAFRIRWDKDTVVFLINNVVVTTFALKTVQAPSGPLAAYINNGNSDNMDLTYMLVRRAASIV